MEFPMIWLMYCESSARRARQVCGGGQDRETKSREEVICELVELDSSPICKALAGGWAALNNDAYWSCYFAYMSLSVPAAIWGIWGGDTSSAGLTSHSLLLLHLLVAVAGYGVSFEEKRPKGAGCNSLL